MCDNTILTQRSLLHRILATQHSLSQTPHTPFCGSGEQTSVRELAGPCQFFCRIRQSGHHSHYILGYPIKENLALGSGKKKSAAGETKRMSVKTCIYCRKKGESPQQTAWPGLHRWHLHTSPMGRHLSAIPTSFGSVKTALSLMGYIRCQAAGMRLKNMLAQWV